MGLGLPSFLHFNASQVARHVPQTGEASGAERGEQLSGLPPHISKLLTELGKSDGQNHKRLEALKTYAENLSLLSDRERALLVISLAEKILRRDAAAVPKTSDARDVFLSLDDACKGWRIVARSTDPYGSNVKKQTAPKRFPRLVPFKKHRDLLTVAPGFLGYLIGKDDRKRLVIMMADGLLNTSSRRFSRDYDTEGAYITGILADNLLHLKRQMHDPNERREIEDHLRSCLHQSDKPTDSVGLDNAERLKQVFSELLEIWCTPSTPVRESGAMAKSLRAQLRDGTAE